MQTDSFPRIPRMDEQSAQEIDFDFLLSPGREAILRAILCPISGGPSWPRLWVQLELGTTGDASEVPLKASVAAKFPAVVWRTLGDDSSGAGKDRGMGPVSVQGKRYFPAETHSTMPNGEREGASWCPFPAKNS